MNTRHLFFFSMFACIIPVHFYINQAHPHPFPSIATPQLCKFCWGTAPARKQYTKHVNYATS